ncbi:unnamed protein product [Closterium sp. Naga37s-1]|nr:unnamed protein product [Closterium sp. Naga37s-1]
MGSAQGQQRASSLRHAVAAAGVALVLSLLELAVFGQRAAASASEQRRAATAGQALLVRHTADALPLSRLIRATRGQRRRGRHAGSGDVGVSSARFHLCPFPTHLCPFPTHLCPFPTHLCPLSTHLCPFPTHI